MNKNAFIFFMIFLLSSILILAQIQPRKATVRPYIKVTSPNGGEEWYKGDGYPIRWKSFGVKGNVKIKLKWGTGSGGWYPVIDSTNNDGNYFYTVPKKGIGHSGDQFRIYVMSEDEKLKDASDAPFSIIKKPTPPLVDLYCYATTMCRFGKLTIKIRIMNKGTKTLHDVLFYWVVLKGSTVIKQDGAGFGLMHPNVWYTHTVNYDAKIIGGKGREEGRYVVRVYADPDNRQNEPSALRSNNTSSGATWCW